MMHCFQDSLMNRKFKITAFHLKYKYSVILVLLSLLINLMHPF